MSSLQLQRPFIRATQPFRTTATRYRYYRTSTRTSTSHNTMDRKFQEGQKVEYHPIGGSSGTSTSTGKIVRVLTEPDAAGSTGVTVKASESDPRYEIQNDNTGKTSAVKEGNIERVL